MLNNLIDIRTIFLNHNLLLKVIHKDPLNIFELFWDVKMEMEFWGETQKYNKHRNGTHFTPQL